MKISVIVRTHNEEKNLQKFILVYHPWVDHILVQDDNSDNTEYLIDMALKYPKVQLEFYGGERFEKGGVSRAYQHLQLNSMIEWAEEIGSDWIIMDDCDCRPNKHLKSDARDIIETCAQDFIYAVRFYFYKDLGYFKDMCFKYDKWMHSLWVWRAGRGFKFIDNDVHSQKFAPIEQKNILRLDPPNALLHYPWQSDEMISTKRERYTAIYGKEYKKFDPRTFGGNLEQPPEWLEE